MGSSRLCWISSLSPKQLRGYDITAGLIRNPMYAASADQDGKASHSFAVYSSTVDPSWLACPLCTASPLARMKSSTFFNWPPSVPSVSLNQPIWSAIRCLFLHLGHCIITRPRSYARFVNSCVVRSPQPSTAQVKVRERRGSICSGDGASESWRADVLNCAPSVACQW